MMIDHKDIADSELRELLVKKQEILAELQKAESHVVLKKSELSKIQAKLLTVDKNSQIALADVMRW